MSTRLPVFIDPIQLVQAGISLEGQVELAMLERLSAQLTDNSGMVQVSLKFDQEHQYKVVRGHLKTHLNLQCQRCLESFDFPVEREIALGIVAGEEEARRLPDYLEPLLLTSSDMPLNDIIEDELLLAIPLGQTHPQGECEIAYNETSLKSLAEAKQPSKSQQAFAVLSQLKHSKRKN
ncbi:MAG: YceD family protein [Gammaproteobacteria bacterium]|nr:YceD family protein [Gammaproteobacteria bacterium]MDH5727771.1 YceD family protein [Gammaproteobacteria bacterium]